MVAKIRCPWFHPGLWGHLSDNFSLSSGCLDSGVLADTLADFSDTTFSALTFKHLDPNPDCSIPDVAASELSGLSPMVCLHGGLEK